MREAAIVSTWHWQGLSRVFKCDRSARAGWVRAPLSAWAPLACLK